MRQLIVLVAVTSLLIATEAEAQQAPQASPPGTQQQSAAQQCLSDINAFSCFSLNRPRAKPSFPTSR